MILLEMLNHMQITQTQVDLWSLSKYAVSMHVSGLSHLVFFHIAEIKDAAALFPVSEVPDMLCILENSWNTGH